MEHIPQARVCPFDHQPNCILFPDISSSDPLATLSVIQEGDVPFALSYDNNSGSWFYDPKPLWSEWARIIQAWGFFGLLRAVCSICDLDYTSHSWSKYGCLSTITLQKLCMEWEMKRHALTRDEIDLRLTRLKDCLLIISRHVSRAFPESARGHSFDAVPAKRDDGPVAVLLLVECFEGWTMRLHDAQDQQPLDLTYRTSKCELISSRLKCAGWEAEEIESIERLTGRSQSYMLMISSIRHHKRGSQEASVKKAVHAADCDGTCHPIAPSQWHDILAAVRAHISAGRTPILRMNNDHEPNLEVHAAGTLPYIAISHVWEDGVNTNYDFVPRCQLRRIQGLADDLVDNYNILATSKPVCFWLDPVCVPKLPKPLLDPSVYDQDVNDALNAMGQVYRKALAVLVLDAGVYSIELAGKDAEMPEITAARIAFSRWMTRGWTFQEAGLAERLFFRFQDMNMNYLEQRILYALAKNARTGMDVMPSIPMNGRLGPVHTLISMIDPCFRHSRNAIDGIWRWWAEDNRQQSACEAVRRLYWRLSERSIGWATDEATIIRHLLPRPGPPLQTDVALQIKPEQASQMTQQEQTRTIHEQHRQLMQDLFSTMDEIPLEILFHGGPHLESTGFRWVPESILRHNSITHMDLGRLLTSRSMKRTTRGVLVDLSAIEFRVDLSPPKQWLLEVDGQLYKLQVSFLEFDWHSMVDRSLVLLLNEPSTALSRRAVLTTSIDEAAESTAVRCLRFEAAVVLQHAAREHIQLTTLPGGWVDHTIWCVG